MPKNPTEKSSKSNTANLLNGNGGKCKTNFVQRKNLNLKDKKNQNEVPEVVDEGNVQNLPLQSFNVAEKSVISGEAKCESTSKKVYKLHGPSDGNTSFAKSPCGTSFVSAGNDGFVTLWSIKGYTEIWKTNLNTPCSAVAFHPSGEVIAIGSIGGQWIILNTSDSCRLTSYRCALVTSKNEKQQMKYFKDDKKVSCLSYSQNGFLLCVVIDTGKTFLYKCFEQGRVYNYYNSFKLENFDIGSSTTRISCSECNQFQTKKGEEFVKHIREKHSFKCSTCFMGNFSSKKDLKKHSKLHEEDKEPNGIVCLNCSSKQVNKISEAILSESENANEKQVTCPYCHQELTSKTLIEHLIAYHNPLHIEKEDSSIQCPICSNSCKIKHLKKHLQKCCVSHDCPKCQKRLEGTDELLSHMSAEHNFVFKDERSFAEKKVINNKNLPKPGDHVLAMWDNAIWQYFPATIVEFNCEDLTYLIDWDDGDSTGRRVSYKNIALDKVPSDNEVGIGSIVLFPQGQYAAGPTQLYGGSRYHQGTITKINKTNAGVTYDGVHTKGVADGKGVSYQNYSFEFKNYNKDELRVGPNIFDLLDSSNEVDEFASGSVDAYLSYENNFTDPSFIPNEVADSLKKKGISVTDGCKNSDLKEKVLMMKRSKVFIACINDTYVLNEQCRMEFQFAKTTLKKPVVPLVVGNGKEWVVSVVGLLIAGELYIHFKDKTVYESKFKELYESLKRSITSLDVSTFEAITEKETKDIFISYCWANSLNAKKNNEIGNLFSDPRYINSCIEQYKFSTWLDIKELTSAEKSVGLFEQILKGLKESSVFVPFISDEYAESTNCRYEFQFAIKVLEKKVVPIIVGSGDNWKNTTIGALLASRGIKPIYLQNISQEDHFKEKLTEIIERIKYEFSSNEESNVSNKNAKVPKVGDHVIARYKNHVYYTATVVSYDSVTLEYTVDWDDGDNDERVKSFEHIALDIQPDHDEVGQGTIALFPQGIYNLGTKSFLLYHEGVVTNVKRLPSSILLDGHHSKSEEDGKYSTFNGYSYTFTNVPLEEIRIAPSKFAALNV